MPCLFLHGGPGFHARVERTWYGDRLPIQWWDQPPIAADDPAPMQTLVAAAGAEVRRLAAASGAPVDLVAHSFGGQIARALAEAMPQRIAGLTLLACSFDPVAASLRFAESLDRAGVGTDELARALAAARPNADFDAVLCVVSATFGVPGVLRRYFAADAEPVAARYLECLLRGPVFDFDTLARVLRDFQRAPPDALPGTFSGPVQLVFGTDDPICPARSSESAWRAVYPHAQVSALPAGHMLHVEAVPDRWFGPRRAVGSA